MNYKLGNHLTLKLKSSNWDFSSSLDSEKIESEMIAFMKNNNGIGLAANQIELTKRVFVMGSDHITNFPRGMGFFNPYIIESSKEMMIDHEGCLSYPGLYLTIKRPEWIIVQFQDSRGHIKEERFSGLASKCFQHELDHLDGICFIDKVSKMKLNLALKKLRKNR